MGCPVDFLPGRKGGFCGCLPSQQRGAGCRGAACRRPRIGIRPRLRCEAKRPRDAWCLVGRLTRSRCLVQADNEKQRRERERREFKEAQELESLRRAFKRMDKKGDGKIDVNELMEELEFLGHKVKPQEAALIIWEVDDDADDCVDWEVSHEPTRARAAVSLSSAPALGSAGVSDDVLPDSGRHHRLRASQALQR